MNITEGNLYDCCTQNSAFFSPTISTISLDNDIVISWIKDSKSLNSWNRQFWLTSTNSSNGLVTFEYLQWEGRDNQTSREFKTSKSKKLNEMLSSAKNVKYEQLIDDSFAFLNENTLYTQHFNNAIDLLLKDLMKIIKVQDFLAGSLQGTWKMARET